MNKELLLLRCKLLSRKNISPILNYLMFAYAFMLPLSKAGINIISGIMILLFLFDKNMKTDLKDLLKNNVILAILLFLAFSIFSFLWTENILNGLKELKTYFHLLPMIIFALYLKKEHFVPIISTFLLAIFISEILSYGIFFEFWQLGHGSPSNPSPVMHHIQYSMFLAFSSLVILNKLFFQSSTKIKIILLFYFITVTANLFLNGGRSGQLAFIITLFLIGFLNIKNKLFAFIFMFVFTLFIFFSAYTISPIFKDRINLAKHEMVSLFSNSSDKLEGSFGNRVAIWIESTSLIKEHPLIGTGIGSELSSLLEQMNHNKAEYKIIKGMAHYHNNYISYMVQLGIIGLILYLNIFYQIYKLEVRDKEFLNIKYIFLSVFSIVSIMDFTFSLQFPLAMFAMFSGIFIAINIYENPINKTFKYT